MFSAEITPLKMTANIYNVRNVGLKQELYYTEIEGFWRLTALVMRGLQGGVVVVWSSVRKVYDMHCW